MESTSHATGYSARMQDAGCRMQEGAWKERGEVGRRRRDARSVACIAGPWAGMQDERWCDEGVIGRQSSSSSIAIHGGVVRTTLTGNGVTWTSKKC